MVLGKGAVEIDVKHCADAMRSCRSWVRLDFCSRPKWAAYMYKYCPLSCQACSPGKLGSST